MHKSVLIIEDDVSIRATMREALELLGYEAQVAQNGREALEILSKDYRPCLILLDLMMPVMDGWEFRRAQEQDPRLKDIPVIVVSADGNAKQKARKMSAL